MTTMPVLPSVADDDFRRYQRLLLEEAGIDLADSKRAMLAGRLARRLRELGVTSYREYFDRLRGDSAERVHAINLLLTNETSFFREPAQFHFLTAALAPAWLAAARARKRRASLRVWSAGCATGEEPYSVAIALSDALKGWTIDILATDLSTAALRRAEQGTWPIERASTIPEELLRRYMLRGVGECAGLMKVAPEIRALVRFRRVNLNVAAQTPREPFDLVLCRNVLIYFEARARRKAIERLIAACRPGGYLFVGHAETLQGFAGVRGVRPTIWRRE